MSLNYSKVTNFFRRVYQKSLDIVREVWRPLGSLGIAVSICVNGVYLPIHLGQIPSLTELAALVAAFAPMAYIRAKEKNTTFPLPGGGGGATVNINQ